MMRKNMEKESYLGLMVERTPALFLLIDDMVLEFFIHRIFQNSRSYIIIKSKHFISYLHSRVYIVMMNDSVQVYSFINL